MQRAREGKGSDLDNAFLTAIQEGRHKAEIRAIGIVTGSEDPRDAQWWLTHHPRTRDTWSDAAADRRAVQRSQDRTIAVLEAAPELTNEQRRMLFARLAAAGEHPDPGSLE